MSTAVVSLPNVNADHTLESDLDHSILAPALKWIYRATNAGRRWRIARILIAIALRLEGGPMRSSTARWFMSTFHGVNVGASSYGDCFDPAIIPPGITIGRYVSIARGVRMFTQNHPLNRLSTHPFCYEGTPGVSATADLAPGKLDIGHDVWIGCNAIITPGCHRIGTGAVIGAGAVVTRDVPEYAIVAGTPARVLRYRFSPEVIERLLCSRWWELTQSEVISRRSEMEELLRTNCDVVSP